MTDKINNSDFSLRSEEVQDILTKVPSWIIRWGSAVLFLLLILVLFVTWLVKYPDVIAAPITITTTFPPQKIIAKTTGKIEAILVENNAMVEKNSPLAVIENSANFNDVFKLAKAISKTDLNRLEFPFSTFKNTQFGEIEAAFALFQKEYETQKINQQLNNFSVEKNAQNRESYQLNERLQLLESQKNIFQNELVLQKKDLERAEKLFKQGIIAQQEFEKNQLRFLQEQKNYKNLLSTISQLKSNRNELYKNQKTTTNTEVKENTTSERNVIQAFYNLKKAISDWELQYVLKTAIAGKITFLQLWATNQNVSSGDMVFSILPETTSTFIGKLKAPAQNSGKIKVGQAVNIRLANFPDKEFGILKGKIKAISLIPDKDGNLLIDVILPNGLLSTYKKTIPFQQEMTGNADIITEDLRLLERIFYQFKSFELK